jgi:putative ABC transport system permease protein
VALALACSVGIAVIVSIESLRKEVVSWLEEILPGDLYLSPPARPGMEAWAKVPPELVEAVEKLPGVQQVEPLRLAQLARPGKPSVRLLGVRADSPNLKAQRLVSGQLETALPRFREGRGVIVSEPLAQREDLEVGARWRLPLPQGWTEFEVVAIHADFATDQGAVLLDLNAFERAFGPGPPSALAVFIEKGEAGKHAQLLVRSLAQAHGMLVQSNRELRAESLRLFDKTFQVAHALRYLTLLVAVLGVASGLIALELERGQELATLVALGITPRARQGFVLLEAIWIGTVAVAASVPLGIFLAYGLLEGINRKSFGWTVTLSPDWSLILLSCLTTLFAATAASWWPARRAARFDPVPYLRFE